MRIPVVDVRGIPLMPCTPPKARTLLKTGKARPRRNKLGVFYLQLTYQQDPDNQPLVVGIVPGSSFSVSGATQPTCQRLWYVVPARLHRRQLQRLEAAKGGIRSPYGGTRSLGLKRGTLVRHLRYGLCTLGGVDRKRGRVSLHAYRTNARLTQGARVEDCQRFTWLAWRSWLVAGKSPPITQ